MQVDDSPHYTEELDSLNHVEESFYASGYAEGFAHGALHGTFEGRALGKEKAFELWEEVGYYEGVAGFWKECLEANGDLSRALTNVHQLLALVALFPIENASTTPSSQAPSSTATSAPESLPDASDSPPPPEVDLSALVERIRARYKLTCSSLGIRPRMVAASSIPDSGGIDLEEEEESMGVDRAGDGVDDGEGGGGGTAARARGKRPLRKGQVLVNGQELSSKSLLF